MACNACGNSALNQISSGLKKLSNRLSGQNSAPPTQTVSGGDANVYGNPVARISSNGTNAKNMNRN